MPGAYSGPTPLRVLRALFILSLTLSMVVYWEGIVNAYKIPTGFGSNSASNTGRSVPSSYQPIVAPQPEVSTLLQEFPPVDPTYVNGPDSVVFHTTFGDYSFSKSQPFMGFTYRDGTPLISHSMFYVNSTFPTPIIPSNCTIDASQLTNRGLVYSINLRTAGSQIGTLQVSFTFDRIQRPKITVRVDPTPALIAHGFNVLWIVRGAKTFARYGAAPGGLDFGNYTAVTVAASNQTRLEFGLRRALGTLGS